MNRHNTNFVPGGYREMWAIAAPMILSMASFMIMQFCDRVFLARYSAVAIQAALPAGMLSWTFISFFQAIASYSGTFTAQYFGAGNKEGTVRSAVQGLWMSVVSSPFIIALVPVGVYCMKLGGHGSAVLEAETVYYRILMIGGVLPILGASIGGYFTGIGKTRVNMVVNMAGCLLNIVLDYGMIFGRFGFSEMGVAGAAYATVISSAFGFVVMLALFLREAYSWIVQTKKNGIPVPPLWKPDMPLFLRILRFGFPSGLQMIMDNGCFTIFVLLIGRSGPVALAASNIAFSINTLAFSPLIGFGIAASTVVAQHLGGGRPEIAEKAGYTGLKLAALYIAVIDLSFLLFPETYFTLFQSHGRDVIPLAELLVFGRPMMTMMAAWGLFDTINIVFGSALKGAGDTKFVMLLIIAVNWLVMLPSMFVLLHFGYGSLALWCVLTGGVFICAVGTIIRWRGGRWKLRKLI